MKRTWLHTLLAAVVIAAVLVSACAPPPTPTPPAIELPTAMASPPPTPTSPPAPTPAKPKTVTITFFEEPDNLNPLYTQMWFAGIAIDFFLVGLWTIDENQEIDLELAAEVPTVENGGISEDGLVLTIKLRQDAAWSDGTPLTAHDFVFTYEMWMGEGNAVQTRYPYDTFVESVTALDDYTLQIVMTEPYVAWATAFFNHVLPKHILEPIYEAEGTIDDADWNRNPTVVNGPFIVKEWEAASHIVFEANPNYWRGRPKLDQVFIRIVPDDEAQMAAIKAGDTDIGVFLSAANKPDIDALPDVEMVSVSSGYAESWFFNLVSEELASETGISPGHPALQDVRVRQALVMAVDRQQIIDELFYGLYRIPAVLWYDTPFEDTTLEPWPYDPEQAKALLDEAGWVDTNGDGTRDKDGVELVLRYSTTAGNELREATQVVVQQMMADVGIGIEILNYSYDTLWNSFGDDGPIASGQYDFAQWSTAPLDYPDPNEPGWLCQEIPSNDYPEGMNWYGICAPELDELFLEQAVTVDRQKRIEMYYEIERIMHEQVYWTGMRTDPDLWSVTKRLQDVRLSGTDPFWNAYEWDVTE